MVPHNEGFGVGNGWEESAFGGTHGEEAEVAQCQQSRYVSGPLGSERRRGG